MAPRQPILAGDALLALASRVVAGPGPVARTAVDWLAQAVIDLCQGQSADLDFERREDVGLAECWTMACNKTAALLGASCALGALAGGADGPTCEKLRGFGVHIGMAFQLVDDLLGIWGDPEHTGKPVHSDLINRKKSLPVVAALRSNTVHGDQLADLYSQETPLRKAETARAAELVERAGGRAWAQDRAASEVERALKSLRAITTDCAAADSLRAVARLMTCRDH